MFSAYGVTAMVAYLPGGAIADRFSPRRLMAISAFTTALGGVYMVTIPSVMGMTLLYGYWGVTSILLFWAALIRSTRAAGGASEQGQVFGLLDAGRGLVAAGVASVVVWLYSSFLAGGCRSGDLARATLKGYGGLFGHIPVLPPRWAFGLVLDPRAVGRGAKRK